MKEISEKITLDSASLLSQEELIRRHVEEQRKQVSAVKPTPSIPDLHDEHGGLSEETPSNYTIRNKIQQEVDNTVTKEDIREQMLQEAREVSTKHADIPVTGVDVLKRIITTGEYKETVELFGFSWTFRALDQMDDLVAIDEMSTDYGSNLANMTAYAFNQVVLSIEAIEGQSIYEIFKEIEQNKYSKKLDYILAVKRALRTYMLQFPPRAITELHDAYKKIDAKRNEGFSELKKS